MRVPFRSLIGAAVLLALAAPACAQRIETNARQPVLAGEALELRLADLKPGQTVRLTARRTVRTFTGEVQDFESQAPFRADAQGRVDLAQAAPLEGGSYQGVDVRGLLWSMRGLPDKVDKPVFNRVQLQLFTGEGEAPIATAQLQLTPSLASVQKRPAGDFPGALFAHPPGAAKRPTLILLGGSEGGSMITREAAVWASQGYAVLALPYYSPQQWTPNGMQPAELPSLPASFTDIPVERLEQARAWLAQQPEADADRIGLMGTSKGAEFVLLAGTRMPWVKAVAAIVPTDVVWEGWGPGVAPGQRSSFSWQGKPFDFVAYKEFMDEFIGMGQGKEGRLRRPHDKGRAVASAETLAKARIPVERIAAPVLVAGSGDDQLWPSGAMAEAIGRSRASAGLPTVVLSFPEAGHFIGGTGTGPTTHYNDGPMKNGGTPQANARAQAELHAALKKFWAERL